MLIWLLISCTSDKNQDTGVIIDMGWKPELVCPSDEGCADVEGAILFAGAAAKTITPTCFESWEDINDDEEYKSSQDIFFDCGCDRLCPEDEGYTAPDEGEGDGEFQAIWIAGYGSARAAAGVHDDLWARTIVLEQGETTWALVSVDLVGFFNDDLNQLRERAAAEGLDFDHITIASTHVHSGPDTLGQWGRRAGESGRNLEYMVYLEDQIIASLAEASSAMQETHMKIGSIDTSTYSPEKGTRNMIHDHRDPKIIDPILHVASFDNNSGETIATLLNFANHPEVLTGLDITSDFVDQTRVGVENGIVYPEYSVEGVGGICIYTSGALGGMMSPLRVDVTDGSGEEFPSNGFPKSEALGRVMAELALDALGSAVAVPDPKLSFSKHTFSVPLENILFQAGFLTGMFDREIENYEAGEMITDDKIPLVATEINLIDIGSLRIQTVPGELLPELAIGGYDDPEQPYTPLEIMIGDLNPNPPDLSQAPAGPYLKERVGGEHTWILGLGNDELGYFIPTYNYKLNERTPYFEEAEGDHYEETNSLGPSAYPVVEEEINRLLEWKHAND